METTAHSAVIRPYRDADFEAAYTIIHEASSEAFARFMQWPYSFDSCRSFFESALPEWSSVWIAECGGEVAGVMCMRGDRISHLFVKPSAQSCGVGTELLAKAREVSPGRLDLYTFQRNLAARRFYERHGFRPVEFGLSEAEGEPDVRYEWRAS